MSRKLDAAIAKALGYSVVREMSIRTGDIIDYVIVKPLGDGIKGIKTEEIPHYSTDGNAVLELIGEMQRVGWKLKIHIFSDEVWVHIFNLDSFYCVAENTMPKAVALAAYEALKGKEWTE